MKKYEHFHWLIKFYEFLLAEMFMESIWVILPSICIATISKLVLGQIRSDTVNSSHSRSNRFCVSDNDVIDYVTFI